MKKFFVFVFVVAFCLLLPEELKAQGVAFQWGGPKTTLLINNSVNRPALVTVGQQVWPLYPGQTLSLKYGYWERQNQALIVDVCEQLTFSRSAIAPPAWATDPNVVGAAAIPAGYNNPDKKILDEAVGRLRAAIKNRLGGRNMRRELDAWAKEVKKHGLVRFSPVCEGRSTVAQVTDVQQWGWNRSIVVQIAKDAWSKSYALRTLQ